jgi:hypothetical protein
MLFMLFLVHCLDGSILVSAVGQQKV